jgi:hypothetical protein
MDGKIEVIEKIDLPIIILLFKISLPIALFFSS